MGETGPAVYPAGYIYVYSLLFKITDGGENIRLGSKFRGCLTISTIHFPWFISCHLGCCIDFVSQIKCCPSVDFCKCLDCRWALLLLCLSKRVKSIYYLRLFNEAILMLPLYLSMFHFFWLFMCSLLFTYQKWFLGVVVMSFALSIKMNILLFFPSLLLILFEVHILS